MGTATFDLSRLLSLGGSTGKRLRKGGALYAVAEIERPGDNELEFEIEGKGLKNVAGMLGTSDPVMIIQRQVVSRRTSSTQNVKWVDVYKSDVMKNTLNPTFPKVRISAKLLINNDPDRSLRFVVEDYVHKKSNKDMGVTHPITVKQMKNGGEACLMKKGKTVGLLRISSFRETINAQYAFAAPVAPPLHPPPSEPLRFRFI